MKRLLAGVLFLCSATLFADPNGLPNGPFPAQVTAIGGRSSTGTTVIPYKAASDGSLVVSTTGSGAATLVKSTALEASHVMKATAGSLISLMITDTTDEYILVINSATVPADGAVTLLMPPIHVTSNSTTFITFPISWPASTGISVCNSSTGTFTKTVGGSTCIYAALVQ